VVGLEEPDTRHKGTPPSFHTSMPAAALFEEALVDALAMLPSRESLRVVA
jgi:hypothetical protein